MVQDASDIRQRTFDYAIKIVKLCSELPSTMPGRKIGGQLFRSGTSVGAQHREAHRAKSDADFISKIEGVLQELDESAYWLELLAATKLMELSRVKPLIDETEQLMAIFVASMWPL